MHAFGGPWNSLLAVISARVDAKLIWRGVDDGKGGNGAADGIQCLIIEG